MNYNTKKRPASVTYVMTYLLALGAALIYTLVILSVGA